MVVVWLFNGYELKIIPFSVNLGRTSDIEDFSYVKHWQTSQSAR